MKKVLFFAVAVMALAFVACNEQPKPATTTETTSTTSAPQVEPSVFYCPMKCEGDKTYDKAGQCPVCGMDLVAMEHGQEETGQEAGSHEGHNH